MSFGIFYAVEDGIRQMFIGRSTKREWYEILGKLSLENVPTCHASESLPAWASALEEHDGPMAKIFSAELAARKDKFDDPDIAFIDADIVKSIAIEMKEKGKDVFKKKLGEFGCDADIWLFDPLLGFLMRQQIRISQQLFYGAVNGRDRPFVVRYRRVD